MDWLLVVILCLVFLSGWAVGRVVGREELIKSYRLGFDTANNAWKLAIDTAIKEKQQ